MRTAIHFHLSYLQPTKLRRKYVETKMPRIRDPIERAAIVDAAAECMQNEDPVSCPTVPQLVRKPGRPCASLRRGMGTLTGYLAANLRFELRLRKQHVVRM